MYTISRKSERCLGGGIGPRIAERARRLARAVRFNVSMQFARVDKCYRGENSEMEISRFSTILSKPCRYWRWWVSVGTVFLLCATGCSCTDDELIKLERKARPFLLAYESTTDPALKLISQRDLISEMMRLQPTLSSERQRYFVDMTIGCSYIRLYYLNKDLDRPAAAEKAKLSAFRYHPSLRTLPIDESETAFEKFVAFFRRIDSKQAQAWQQAKDKQNEAIHDK